MQSAASLHTPCQIGPHLIFPERLEIQRDDRAIRVEPKVMKLLGVLIDHYPQVVTRESLCTAIWDKQVVSDAALNRLIAQLRKALGDNSRQPVWIETISKTGYRLLAPPEPIIPDRTAVHSASVNNQSSPVESASPLHRLRPVGLQAFFMLFLILTGITAVAYAMFSDRTENTVNNQAFDFSHATTLTVNEGFEENAAVSADNQYMVFKAHMGSWRQSAVVLQSLASGKNVQIKVSSPHAKIYRYRWKPDSHELYVSVRQGGSRRIHRLDISAESFNGDIFADKGEIIYSCQGFCLLMDFDFIEHNQKLLLLVQNEENPNSGLVIFDPADGSTQTLYSLNMQQALYRRLSVSPDQSQIIIQAYEFSGYQSLLLRVHEPSTARPLELPSGTMQTVWHRNNRHVIWLNSQSGIGWFDTQTQTSKQIYQSPQPIYSLGLDSLNRLSVSVMTHGPDILKLPMNTDQQSPSGQLAVNDERSSSAPQVAHHSDSLAWLDELNGRAQLMIKQGQQPPRMTAELSMMSVLMDWSPDDRYLLLSVEGKALVIDVENGQQHWLSNDGVINSPVFSADSQSIYFSKLTAAADGNEAWQVWRMDLSGQNATQVTWRGGWLVRRAMDGSGIYYFKKYTAGIWFTETHQPALSEDTFVEALVVENFMTNYWPHFYDTQRGLIYSGQGNGKTGIYLHSRDTQRRKKIMDWPASRGYYFAVSDDGDSIWVEDFTQTSGYIQRFESPIGFE